MENSVIFDINAERLPVVSMTDIARVKPPYIHFSRQYHEYIFYYILEGKNQLVVSIGCTGGKHRSVTLANALYQRLEQSEEYGVRIEHRDIGKDAIRKKMNEVR